MFNIYKVMKMNNYIEGMEYIENNINDDNSNNKNNDIFIKELHDIDKTFYNFINNIIKNL